MFVERKCKKKTILSNILIVYMYNKYVDIDLLTRPSKRNIIIFYHSLQLDNNYFAFTRIENTSEVRKLGKSKSRNIGRAEPIIEQMFLGYRTSRLVFCVQFNDNYAVKENSQKHKTIHNL